MDVRVGLRRPGAGGRHRDRRPRRVGFYLGRFSFSSTHFLNASTDPNPPRLAALRDRVEFVPASAFLPC